MANPVDDLRADLERLLSARARLEGSRAGPRIPSPGVRRRLTALALEASVNLASREQERLQWEAFSRSMEVVLRRVEGRAARVVAALPPPVATAPAPAAPVIPAPSVRRASRSPGLLPPSSPSPRGPRAPVVSGRRPSLPASPLPAFWSAQRLLGFRRWEVAEQVGGEWRPWPAASSSGELSLPTKKALLGAWRPWPTPSARARCVAQDGREIDDGQVPHTDGRCGHPPCGLYAYKEPGDLIEHFGLNPVRGALTVFGLVSLAGKVVEHERGYRAQLANVEAAAVVGGGRLIAVDGPEDLRCLFADPQSTLSRLIVAGEGRVRGVRRIRQTADLLVGYLGLMRDLYDAVRG